MKHDLREHSLIVFTILSQLAVGAFWILMVTDVCVSWHHDIAHTAGISMAPLLMLLAAMHVSMVVALTHLGSPLIAYKALANIRYSWLSREILTANFFIGTAVAFTGMQWLEFGSTGLRIVVAWLTVLSGGSLLYSMSRVYMLRTVPIWNNLFTPVSFFLSALILGPLSLGLVFTICTPGWLPAGGGADIQVLPSLTKMALLFLGIQFLLVPARIVGPFAHPPEAMQALKRVFERHKKIILIRFATNLLGVAGLIAMLLQSHYDPFCYFFGFAIILVSDLLDRYVFYAAREVSRL
jgi:anaerobic dimethyl sulfoxide reductase subunit C (anchor subunit)